MKLLFTPHGDVLYTVLTARIIINIRVMGQQGMRTELHTNYYRGANQTVSDTPIQFIRRGGDRTTAFEESSTRYDGEVITDAHTIDRSTGAIQSNAVVGGLHR